MGAMRKSDDSKLREWSTSNMEYGNFYKLKLTVEREKEDVELKDIHAECKRELEALRKELEQCKAQLLRDYNSLMQSPPSSTSCCCSCTTSCSCSCTVRRPIVSKLETNCNVEEGSRSHDNKQASKTRMQAGGRLHAARRCASSSSSHANLKSPEQENHPVKTVTKGQHFRAGPKGESMCHKRKLKEIISSSKSPPLSMLSSPPPLSTHTKSCT